MKRRLETLSWATIILERRFTRLNPTPEYQRDSVWTKAQKQLLIDSIVLNLDIPKLYFRMLTADPEYDYEIIDGQQRVRAIYEFRRNAFELSNEYTPQYGGMCYDDLPEDVRDQIDMYALDIVVIEEATDDMIREMFLRLQNGTQLSAAEKRNAMGGVVHEFVDQLTRTYGVISSVQRYRIRQFHQETAAQCVLLELRGKQAVLTDKHIVELYETYEDFDPKSEKARHIRQAFMFLDASLGADTTALRSRAQFVSLYWLVSCLQDVFNLAGFDEAFRDFVIDFDRRSREDDPTDPPVKKYLNAMKSSPHQWSSIQARHDALMHSWLLFAQNLPLKATTHTFNPLQRQVVYRRDEGVCRICGETVNPRAFEVRHVVPVNQGGRTTVANGQTVHMVCSASRLLQKQAHG